MGRVTFSVPLGFGFRYSETVWRSRPKGYRAQIGFYFCPHAHRSFAAAQECKARTMKTYKGSGRPRWR